MRLLLSIHLNDNGINYDEETYHSILEIFGNDRVLINENDNKDADKDPKNFKLNKYVNNSEMIKKTVAKYTNKVEAREILDSNPSALGIE